MPFHPGVQSKKPEQIMPTLEAQGRLPQDTPQWHINYLEFKLLEKLWCKKKTDFSVLLEAEEESPIQ